MTFNFCFLWYFLCVYVCLQILTRPRLNAYWLWHLGKRSRFKPALLLAFKINVCSVCILVFTYRSNSLKISLTAYYVFVISDSPPFLLLVALRHGRASETNILSGERRVGFAATLRSPWTGRNLRFYSALWTTWRSLRDYLMIHWLRSPPCLTTRRPRRLALPGSPRDRYHLPPKPMARPCRVSEIRK